MLRTDTILSPNEAIKILKIIYFHISEQPRYTGEYTLVLKFNNDSITKKFSFIEPINEFEKNIYEEYSSLRNNFLNQIDSFDVIRSKYANLYKKIYNSGSNSDYLCHVAYIYFSSLLFYSKFSAFKEEFFNFLDRKNTSYCIDMALDAYYDYYFNFHGAGPEFNSGFYSSLVSRYENNEIIKELIKMKYSRFR